MRTVIIGGTGHVGTYLVPKLVRAGHEVISVSRQKHPPYHTAPEWKSVEQVCIDRNTAELANDFGRQIRDLKPDIVIDMICFTLDSARELVEALQGRIMQFLHCGTIWVHGHSECVPTTETQERHPIGDYGIKKAAIESYLHSVSRQSNFPATILHPGHIVGPGWLPINPAGNLDADVFKHLAEGKQVVLPNNGMETLHHVHAEDVAQAFIQTIRHRDQAIGESFHVVSEQALTLRGYAMAMAVHYNQKANLKFLPWEEWKNTVSEQDAALTWDHIIHSPNCSINKAKQRIYYRPHYSSLQAIQESVDGS